MSNPNMPRKDPYQKTFKQIADAISTLHNMIIELAKRTMTMGEFEEFTKAVNAKKNKEEKKNDFTETDDKDPQGSGEKLGENLPPENNDR